MQIVLIHEQNLLNKSFKAIAILFDMVFEEAANFRPALSFDASKDLEVAEHVQLQLDVQKNLEDEDKNSHPLQSGGINLCALIQSVITAKRPASSDINNYTIKELRLALKGIGNTSYKGKSRFKICGFFKDHVKEYCDCLEAFIK